MYEPDSHNTWNITAAARTNLNSTITYKLHRNYTFHDTYSTRLRIATIRRQAPYYRPPIEGG